MIEDALARIAAKLAALQAQGWETFEHHFNVKAHRLEIGPTLTEDAVAAFEATNHVTLPADYRAFITTIAGSGAGPYYGLLPLACWQPEVIGLCEQGCGYWTGLVVGGPNRGRVVNVYDDDPTISPAPSFLDWYEGWLDSLRDNVATGAYGWFRGGSEETLVAALTAATAPDEQLDIITSLHHRPILASATLDQVAALITSPDARIRAVCCNVLAREQRWIDTVCPLLDDPDIKVRSSVIYALDRMDARTSAPALGRLVARDYDQRTNYAATSMLAKWGLLRGSMLVPALQSKSAGVRGSIPKFLEGLDDDLTPFESLLADPDLHVRIYTVRAFAKRGAFEALHARLPDEPNEALRAAIAKHVGDGSRS